MPAFDLSPQGYRVLLDLRRGQYPSHESLADLPTDDECYLQGELAVRRDRYAELDGNIPPGASWAARTWARTFRDAFTNPSAALESCEALLASPEVQGAWRARLLYWQADLNFLCGHFEAGRRFLDALPPIDSAGPVFSGELAAVRGLCHFLAGDPRDAITWHKKALAAFSRSPDVFFQVFNASMALRVSLQLCDHEEFERFSQEIELAQEAQEDCRYRMRQAGYRAMILAQHGDFDLAARHWRLADSLLGRTKMAWERGQYLTLRGLGEAISDRRDLAEISFKLAGEELAAAGNPGPYVAELRVATAIIEFASPSRRSRSISATAKAIAEAELTLAREKRGASAGISRIYDDALSFCETIRDGLSFREVGARQSLVISIAENMARVPRFAARISDLQVTPEFVRRLDGADLSAGNLARVFKEIFGIGPIVAEDKLVFDETTLIWQSRPEMRQLAHLAHLLLKLRKASETSSRTEALGKVAAQLAHDIRSPLGALEALSAGFGDDEGQALLRPAIARIRDIANDLLRQHRSGNSPDKSNEEQSRERIALLAESVVSEKRMASRDTIAIASTCAREGHDVFAMVQPSHFQRIVSNILDNAIQAMGESAARRGAIRVRVVADALRARVEFEDEGAGFDPEILALIGQEPVSGKQGGNGLGLWHAVQTVKLWGGDIEFEARQPRGSRVTIDLPRALAPC